MSDVPPKKAELEKSIQEMTPAELDELLRQDEMEARTPLIDPGRDPMVNGEETVIIRSPIHTLFDEDVEMEMEVEKIASSSTEKANQDIDLYVSEIIQVKSFCQNTHDCVVTLVKAVEELSRRLDAKENKQLHKVPEAPTVSIGEIGQVRLLKRPSNTHDKENLREIKTFNFAATPTKERSGGQEEEKPVPRIDAPRLFEKKVEMKEWNPNLFVGAIPRKQRKEMRNSLDERVPHSESPIAHRMRGIGRSRGGYGRGRGAATRTGTSIREYSPHSAPHPHSDQEPTCSDAIDCHLCEKRHSVMWCPVSNSLDEKKNIALRKGLCFRCLGQHHQRHCSAESVCSHCQCFPHHTLLCPMYHNLRAEMHKVRQAHH